MLRFQACGVANLTIKHLQAPWESYTNTLPALWTHQVRCQGFLKNCRSEKQKADTCPTYCMKSLQKQMLQHPNCRGHPSLSKIYLLATACICFSSPQTLISAKNKKQKGEVAEESLHRPLSRCPLFCSSRALLWIHFLSPACRGEELSRDLVLSWFWSTWGHGSLQSAIGPRGWDGRYRPIVAQLHYLFIVFTCIHCIYLFN